MNLPIHRPNAIEVTDSSRFDDFAALAGAFAHARAEGAAIAFVYAPTSIRHTTNAPAPVAMQHSAAPRHLGIDIDLTGYGDTYAPPSHVAPLPPITETRTFAPLAFVASGCLFLGTVVSTAITGSPAAIAAGIVMLGATGASTAALLRSQS